MARIRKSQIANRNWKQPARGSAATHGTLRVGLCMALVSLAAGCILGRQNPAATQPATAIDAAQATPAFWMKKPAVVHVRSTSFDALWNACRQAAKADGFLIDRTDYREGILTTLPLVSKAAYEFWRDDVVNRRELAQSTLSTVRRTVRFDVRRGANGSFQATPRVLVERYSLIERRVTSVAQYWSVFAITPADVSRANEENGEVIPAAYWYPIGRDYALERQLADSIRHRLK